MVTWQVPVPEQPAPVQPVKSEPVSGVAVSVTLVPWSKPLEHVAPQSIPAGLELTDPVPVPSVETFRVSVFRANVAVTERAWSMVTGQVPVPEQPAPVQPVKSEPVSGVAVSVTDVPKAKSCVHVAPQSIPAGLELTDPVPVPSVETFRVSVFRVNVAVTERAWSIVTTQSPVPEQPAPVQPVKSELAAGVAVRLTDVP